MLTLKFNFDFLCSYLLSNRGKISNKYVEKPYKRSVVTEMQVIPHRKTVLSKTETLKRSKSEENTGEGKV